MQTGPVRLATPFPPRLHVTTIMIPPYVLSIYRKHSISLTFTNRVALANRLATPDAPSTTLCLVLSLGSHYFEVVAQYAGYIQIYPSPSLPVLPGRIYSRLDGSTTRSGAGTGAVLGSRGTTLAVPYSST